MESRGGTWYHDNGNGYIRSDIDRCNIEFAKIKLDPKVAECQNKPTTLESTDEQVEMRIRPRVQPN